MSFDELRAAVERATPGPWESGTGDGVTGPSAVAWSHMDGKYDEAGRFTEPDEAPNAYWSKPVAAMHRDSEGWRGVVCGVPAGDRRDADAEFIALARRDVPALLARIDALEAVAAAAREYRASERVGGGCDIETTARLGDRVESAAAALDCAIAALGGEG